MFSSVDKAVEALLRGQESANCLKTVFEHQRTSSVLAEPLLDTVLDSFKTAISFLNNFTSSEPRTYRDSSQNTATHASRKSPKKKRYGEDGSKHHSVDSPTPLSVDGFAWRKYGQKIIKSSVYIRCYYRCASANGKKCNATKRVQQIQDNPSVYRTTYVGQHICKKSTFPQPSDYGFKMIQFEKFDQAMPESITPQFVSVNNHQEITIEDEPIENIMNQECHSNELLMNDNQFLAYQIPLFFPEIPMFLNEIDAFDNFPSQY